MRFKMTFLVLFLSVSPALASLDSSDESSEVVSGTIEVEQAQEQAAEQPQIQLAQSAEQMNFMNRCLQFALAKSMTKAAAVTVCTDRARAIYAD